MGHARSFVARGVLFITLAGCWEEDGECPLEPAPVARVDADGDGFPSTSDCDDDSSEVNPGARERCDGEDNNCDGTVDEEGAADAETWYADADGDGYGDAASATISCGAPDGAVADGTDCEDTDPAYHPGADETCDDPTDYNCDGSTGYSDADEDGSPACEDCDDSAPAAYPGASEVCDGLDNDCEGSVDEDATDAATWYTDADGDGYGDAGSATTACDAPDRTVADGTDCDDADPAYHPAAVEDCDAPYDYDCDGSVGYADADGDGSPACEDCDDSSALAYPGAAEVCDGIDDDCDGEIDEAEAEDVGTWYTDADGDGYGDPDTATTSCDAPGGTVANGADCDDADPVYHPGATEYCDDPTDYNCDGSVGYLDADGDGSPACEDCDDSTADAYPGATEVCDDLDNDCDGTTDTDAVDRLTWYADADGDEYGDPLSATTSCAPEAGGVANAADCDDESALVYPGAPETCDGLDDDCDGEIDENDDVTDASTWHADADGDGHGDPAPGTWACEAPAGEVAGDDDCDDTSATIYPGAPETCDELDDDCDGEIDEDEATDATTWYADEDADGYGDDHDSLTACAAPSGYVETSGDCDDADSDYNPGATESCADPTDYNCDGSVGYADADGDGTAACEDCDDASSTAHPGATETCNGADDDCDGVIDEDDAADAEAWYVDADADGHGDPRSATWACSAPSGYVASADDCDDTASATSPDATEICDGVDDDCDGNVDEDSAADASTWYPDGDADGYGAGVATVACEAPSGYVAQAGDCDDADPAYNPGADEPSCTDPNDYNCDGSVGYADADADGSPACEDCDDASSAIYPGATEVCDGVDDDCDGDVDEDDAAGAEAWYTDADEDGYGDASQLITACDAPAGTVAISGDCDDADPAYNPGAEEADCTDSHDYNCDGRVVYEDGDGDGYAACEDCDDTSGAISPGATETCDGLDDDCDGSVDEDAADALVWYADADGDSYGDLTQATASCEAPPGYVEVGTDCDDANGAISPVGTERCDGLDDDCDGLVDDDDPSVTGTTSWYLDGDEDGYGEVTSLNACDAPTGWVDQDGDCDDTDPAYNPGAEEADCTDPNDYNCDGSVGYADDDRDGFAACEECDDASAVVYPGAVERCDGLDDDCDGEVDEDAIDETAWYADGDGDSYGDAARTTVACDAPGSYVSDDTDCDDADASVYPGADESWDDGSDSDCDGVDDPDICTSTPPLRSVTSLAECSIPWEVEVEWTSDDIAWSAGTSALDVAATPAIGDINDDGIPDVVFTSYDSSVALPTVGWLRAMSGDGSGEIFSVSTATLGATTYTVSPYGGVALGDLDGDGQVEIVTASYTGRALGFSSAGALEAVSSDTAASGYRNLAPVIDDLDGDGTPEVLLGRLLLRNDLTTILAGSASSVCGGLSYAALSADLFADGDREAICGRGYMSSDGTTTKTLLSGSAYQGIWPGVIDVNGDDQLEVVLVHSYNKTATTIPPATVQLYTAAGVELDRWAPADTSTTTYFGGPPVVADVTGDGQPEIGVAYKDNYYLLSVSAAGELSELSSHTISDSSSAFCGSSAFDLDGDGAYEILYADEDALYIMDGEGDDLISPLTAHDASTQMEYPLAVDVDADGDTELVVAGNSTGGAGWGGVTVLRELNGAWAPTGEQWTSYAWSPDEGALLRGNLNAEPWTDDAANLSVTVEGACEDCAGGAVTLTVSVLNDGLADSGAYDLSVYALNGANLTWLSTTPMSSLGAGQATDPFGLDFDVSEVGADGLVLSVDDSGGRATLGDCEDGSCGSLPECAEDDNSSIWNDLTCI